MPPMMNGTKYHVLDRNICHRCMTVVRPKTAAKATAAAPDGS